MFVTAAGGTSVVVNDVDGSSVSSWIDDNWWSSWLSVLLLSVLGAVPSMSASPGPPPVGSDAKLTAKAGPEDSESGSGTKLASRFRGRKYRSFHKSMKSRTALTDGSFGSGGGPSPWADRGGGVGERADLGVASCSSVVGCGATKLLVEYVEVLI
jgi:hypothetical protein